MFTRPDVDIPVSLVNPTEIVELRMTPDGMQPFAPRDRAAAISTIANKATALMRANADIQERDQYRAETLFRTYVTSPNELVKPANIISRVNIKLGTPHKDFRKRKAAGELMVSDYERCSIVVRQEAGYVSGTLSSDSHLINSNYFEELGLTVPVYIPNGDYHIQAFPGTPYATNSLLYLRYNRVKSVGGGWHFDPALSAGSILQLLREQNPDSQALVTNVLAKVNRSSVDLLTALAELPKAIKSAVAGVKLVTKVLQGFKKKEFSISKSYETKKRLAAARYNKRVARLDKELQSPNLSPLRRETLLKFRNRITMSHKEAMLGFADEFANELANVWLNYRYNIMPNVYVLQDIIEANEKFARRWVRASGTVKKSFSLPLDKTRLNVDHDLKVMIKRGFSMQAAYDGKSVISANLFVTAWELVPLSFVVDWFVNVGDLIASPSYNFDWEQQGATLANKYTFNSGVVYKHDLDFTIEPQTTVQGFYYRRKVINPTECIGLAWQPNLGLERQIDAAALLWRPVRSILQNIGKR